MIEEFRERGGIRRRKDPRGGPVKERKEGNPLIWGKKVDHGKVHEFRKSQQRAFGKKKGGWGGGFCAAHWRGREVKA